MSGRNRQKKTPQKKKNPIKKRLELLEGLLGDGIDKLVLEIQRVDGNIYILAGGLEDIDDNTAALRALGVEKGFFTEEEFESKKKEIADIRLKAREEAARKAEEAEKEPEPEAEPEDPTQPDAELVAMRDAAVAAGQDEGVPDGAFVFGGD
jgi:hypothetical protein